MFNKERNSLNSHGQKRIDHVFVPVTDEIIFDSPELIEGPLVPYCSGMACHGWLSVELNPDESHSIDERAEGRKGRAYELLHKVGLSSEAKGESSRGLGRVLKPIFSS